MATSPAKHDRFFHDGFSGLLARRALQFDAQFPFLQAPRLLLDIETKAGTCVGIFAQPGLVRIALVKTRRNRVPPFVIEIMRQDFQDFDRLRQRRRRRNREQHQSAK